MGKVTSGSDLARSSLNKVLAKLGLEKVVVLRMPIVRDLVSISILGRRLLLDSWYFTLAC